MALAMSVVDAAKALIGCTLAHEDTVGVIVETEAYHETEPACHAFIGETTRTRVLFEAPGRIYVYRSYGIHALANIVVEPAGVGAAVLLRALEPIEGLHTMAMRRGRTRPQDLCSGPGKLTQALDIELIHNDTSVRDGPIRLGPPPRGWERPALAIGPRIGITKAADLPWRFCAAESIHVSRPWPPGMRVTQGARPSS
jgi:DNA-3-methyladenine glycosylase